jgi:DNA polymerase-1|tara:strand:+ start:2783 stop:3748 length:966 start_codon:yes stop_codon:yes gene_type:complete
MHKDRVLLIDGLNLFTRHFIANPAMSENGDHVGGVSGFFNAMMYLVEKCKPESVIVIWEGGGSDKKRGLFKDYKKGSRPQKLNRYYEDDIPSTYENRSYQLKTLIAILSCVPVCQTYISGAEADDAIGYLSKYLLKEKNKIIISSDHDFYQLVNEKTIIWSPTLKAFVDKEKVIERFGIHPNNFCLAKSITGDPSDNIPGVKGVGYKSLSKRFQKLTESNEYMLYDMIVDAKSMARPKGPKIFENIVNNESLIRRNNKLVLLDTNNLSLTHIQKIESDIENFIPAWNNMNMQKILKASTIKTIDPLRWNYLLRNLKKGTIK